MPTHSRKRKSGKSDPAAAQPTIFGLPRAVVPPLAVMIAVILLVAAARIRLLGVPLERDEGEYAYMGQLMLQGVPPYGAAANMKLPGTSAAYALLMAIFGQSAAGIHFGFLLVNLGSVVLVFLLAKKLFGVAAGIPAAAAYAVLSTGASVLGIWAHATHFVVLPALGAILLLLRWAESRRVRTLVGSGLLFGLAFLMKQPGILFALFGGGYVLYVRRRSALRELAIFGAAVLLPFGITCLILAWAGVFGRFWFWVFTYGRQYASMLSLSAGAGTLSSAASAIWSDNWGICLVAAAGLFAGLRAPKHRTSTAMVAALLVCSFLAVCPGFYFRKHYFVLMLPAVALAVGGAWAAVRNQALALWLTAGALLIAVGQQSDFLFRMNPLEVSRAAYQSNPFPEAIPLAGYIRDHTGPQDRIAVLGSEPEIYFYARRRSVTPFVYTYSMMEPQPYAPRMQAEFIHDVESAAPKYLVVVNVSASWLPWKNSPLGVLRWVGRYSTEHYRTVGVADILPGGTVYKWDADAAHYVPRSSNSVLVMRRL